jgi:hypothetical protein
MLLQLNGVTYHSFPLWVRLATFKSANISKTVRAGWGVSKEHENKFEVDLSIDRFVSASWRPLPPISANDMFSRLLKRQLHEIGESLFIDFPSKTAKFIVKKNLISF